MEFSNGLQKDKELIRFLQKCYHNNELSEIEKEFINILSKLNNKEFIINNIHFKVENMKLIVTVDTHLENLHITNNSLIYWIDLLKKELLKNES